MYEFPVAIGSMAPHFVSTRSISLVAKNDRIVSGRKTRLLYFICRLSKQDIYHLCVIAVFFPVTLLIRHLLPQRKNTARSSSVVSVTNSDCCYA